MFLFIIGHWIIINRIASHMLCNYITACMHNHRCLFIMNNIFADIHTRIQEHAASELMDVYPSILKQENFFTRTEMTRKFKVFRITEPFQKVSIKISYSWCIGMAQWIYTGWQVLINKKRNAHNDMHSIPWPHSSTTIPEVACNGMPWSWIYVLVIFYLLDFIGEFSNACCIYLVCNLKVCGKLMLLHARKPFFKKTCKFLPFPIASIDTSRS